MCKTIRHVTVGLMNYHKLPGHKKTSSFVVVLKWRNQYRCRIRKVLLIIEGIWDLKSNLAFCLLPPVPTSLSDQVSLPQDGITHQEYLFAFCHCAGFWKPTDCVWTISSFTEHKIYIWSEYIRENTTASRSAQWSGQALSYTEVHRAGWPLS